MDKDKNIFITQIELISLLGPTAVKVIRLLLEMGIPFSISGDYFFKFTKWMDPDWQPPEWEDIGYLPCIFVKLTFISIILEEIDVKYRGELLSRGVSYAGPAGDIVQIAVTPVGGRLTGDRTFVLGKAFLVTGYTIETEFGNFNVEKA